LCTYVRVRIPGSHAVKTKYSKIVKSELRRSNSYAATCINMYYKLQKMPDAESQ